MKKKQFNYQWLGLAREAMIRAGVTSSAADAHITEITGDHRDLDNDLHQASYDLASGIANGGSGWEDPG
jgi:hypothetical protein